MSERKIVVVLQVSNISVLSWWEQVTFWWDDEDIHFVLDQHTVNDIYVINP